MYTIHSNKITLVSQICSRQWSLQSQYVQSLFTLAHFEWRQTLQSFTPIYNCNLHVPYHLPNLETHKNSNELLNIYV